MGIAETLLVEQREVDKLPLLSESLLLWYRRCARSLPWRDEPTPYRVWISEVMLQQTRVEAVRGYFLRFVEALPDVAALAAVEEERLLKLWEGLGYYSRARNLQRAAQVMVERHMGKLPASYAALRELPGIGPYTAGAVASIAFGIPVPAADGNVYRVLSRILGSYAGLESPRVKAAFSDAAALMLPQEQPGDLNQALMELGATVCVPNAAPRCLECPVSARCTAYDAGCAQELPVLPAKKARRVEQRTIVLAVSERGVLLQQRPGKGLLPGLYQPVNLEAQLDQAQVLEALAAIGAKDVRLRELPKAKHIFTHVQWEMCGFLAETAAFEPGESWLWASPAEVAEQYALPSAFRAFVRELQKYWKEREVC